MNLEQLQTRTAQAERTVKHFRETLALHAAEAPLSDLATIVNELAEAQGQWEAYARVLRAAEYQTQNHPDEVDEAVRASATDLVLSGADDRWSGRSNDAQRARFDGVREAVRAILGR